MLKIFSTDMLNKYLKCSVWKLAVRYDIHVVRRQRVNVLLTVHLYQYNRTNEMHCLLSVHYDKYPLHVSSTHLLIIRRHSDPASSQPTRYTRKSTNCCKVPPDEQICVRNM
jgi:hypothetical protein